MSFEDGEIEINARTVKTIVTVALVIILAIVLFAKSFYTVDAQHNAVITQFGSIVRVDTAGPHLKLPWQSCKKVDITTHGTGIGYTVTDDGQNITDADDGIMITSDFNLLNIDFYMEYRICDPVAYLYSTDNPGAILYSIAMANIRTVVSNYTVDEAMTTSKAQIEADVKQAILEDLEAYDIGLTISNITIQDAEPPTNTIIQAFKAVENARQGADTAMNKANEYKNTEVPAAEADADAIRQQAEAQKTSRIAEAEGQVARFNAMYEEYKNYPLVTKRRLFFEKMNEIMPGLKVIITDGETQTMLPLDSFSLGSGSNYQQPAAASAPASE